MLDFIVERKSVRDLDGSIIDGRYVQQKWWLDRCGLKHVMYLLEGCPEGMMHTAGGWEGERSAGQQRQLDRG